MPDMQRLVDRRDDLREQLLAVGDLRPGTLVEHFRKCGKPNCRCARPGERGHGPSWLLSRTLKGRSKSFRIPAPEVEETRRLIAEHQRFRALLSDFLEASEALAEARRRGARDGGEASKRGRSKPRSRRRPPPKPSG